MTLSVTTRVDAAVAADYPYQLWDASQRCLIISDEEYEYTSNGLGLYDIYDRAGNIVTEGTGSRAYSGLWTSSANSYILVYTDATGWSASPTNYTRSTYEMYYVGIYVGASSDVVYSSHSIDGFASAGTIPELPDGIDVEALIDEKLNAQTATGTQAAQIINNTTINYNSYVAGDITHTEIQQIVTDNLDQLSELSGATGNTLSDLMQINNAITYNQSIQDQLHNTVSSTTLDLINQYLSATNSDVYEYQNGTRDQQSATNSIRNRIRYLEARIVDGTINTTADIAAVQTAISTMQAALDSVIGYSDLSQEVSDKSQASDQAELDLLNEMVSVMQQEEIENPMQDQQTMADAVAVRDSISDIWINKYMLALSAMFGMLVIPCIILRTHYRMM